ncbi:mediator of DNA damage checkpoint protein 1 isoform X3 [Tamandua tetradactyla]|uniref:mediator of DNA damage checkpoint protein 1 isoform X3 n=1 Tax=Tamandua tetradactyla TaxID=48850 RepID=UPI004053C4AA
MEDTQVIDWEVDEEEEEERASESLGYSLEPLGRLHIFGSAHGPEKDFPLYLGKNVVGRKPDCSVALPFPSISKQHAVIEILALDKAPLLRDCGSLNGTQILRPPKVLSPGVSHRLRDQELILFADLPCQYHRLDVPLPFVSRGTLTVEETPRVQAGTQPQGLLLAEDSEEEVDFSERCIVKESKSTSSPLATVVPESDEESASPAQGSGGPPFAFNLESDTDEEGEQPASGEVSSTSRRSATAEADGVAVELHLKKNQPSAKEVDNERKVESDTGKSDMEEDSDTDVDDDSKLTEKPADVHLERGQSSPFIDSDTDVEEEGIPATLAVVPVKKRQIFHGVSTKSPGVHLQESQAGSDADVEKGEAPPPLERSQPSIVLNSDTDDEDEISAALALSLLKESRTITGNKDVDVEEDRAQSMVLPEQSLTSAGRDSDIDMEEEELQVEKRQSLPKCHTNKDGALVLALSEKSQPLPGDSDVNVVEDKDLFGTHLERSQTSTMVNINTEVEEEVPSGPAFTHLEKHKVPEERTNKTDKEAEGNPAKVPVVHLEEAQLPPDCEMDAEEGMSLTTSAMADVRKSQLPAERDAGTEWAAAVLKRERALEAGAQGGSPVTQVEQDLLPVSRENLTHLVVGTGTPGEPTQPHREGAQTPTEREREPHVHGIKDSEDSHDDSEDLDLQATQCFVARENQSLEAVQNMEDEPTQAFLFTLPQEAGPSCCSFHTSGVLDEPWEVLATQPFCLREAEASETQHTATCSEARGTCHSLPRTTLQDQQPESPVHTEPLGIRIRGMHTMEKDMGTPRIKAERVTSEREPLERETKKLPPGEREDVLGEGELTRRIQEREQKQLLVRDPQRQESDKNMKNANTEKDMESLKVEVDTSKEIEEKEIEEQTLRREIFEREAERPATERVSEPAGLEVKIPKVILEKGTQREEDGGSQDQKGQAFFPKAEPGVGAGALQELASAPVTSGSQSGRGRVVPLSTRRQQRGHANYKMPPAEKTSRGDQKSPDACLRPSAPEASASLPTSSKPQTTSQGPKLSVPQPILSPLPLSLESPIPRTRQNGSQEVPETPMSSELEPLHAKSKVRPRGSSRMTHCPVSFTALEPHPTTHLTCQPIIPDPASQVTRGRTCRSSEMIPASVVPKALELHSTSTDQPVTPKPILQATRGRTHRSSVKIPEPVESTDLQPVTLGPILQATRGRTRRFAVKTSGPHESIAPHLQPPISTDHPVTPEPMKRATRSRAHRSSVSTPEPVIPTASELQPSASTDQPVNPEPILRATRGRTHRSSVKTSVLVESATLHLKPPITTDQPFNPGPMLQATRGRAHRSSLMSPEPMIPTAPDLQTSTSTDQSVNCEPMLRVTRGRTHRSSEMTLVPIVPTAPELQTSTSSDQPVTPEPMIRATRGRAHRSSFNTPEPIIPTASELQPSTSIDQPVTRKPILQATQGKAHRSSVKTPKPVDSTALHLELPTPTDQPVTSKPMVRATRGRVHRSSVKTSEPIVPIAPELQPSTSTEQPVIPESITRGGQSRTLRSSSVSAVPVPITPEFQPPVPTDQPVPPEPVPQAICSKRQRAIKKPESFTAPIVHEPRSVPPETKSYSSRSQRRGAVRITESSMTIPEPSFPQFLEAPSHALQIQKIEASGISGSTPESQPKVSQSRKRLLAIMDSSPLQKRSQRGEGPQKTVSLKEEEEPTERLRKEEDAVILGQGKRKRGQAEEEPKGTLSHNLRRTKANQEPTAPRVLFTGVVDARGERAVLALGGSLAGSVAEASHLVTDRIRRTVKFLCALGRGIPILTLDWLHQSRKAGYFLPPDEYVVTDPEQERNFGFSLRNALSRARERRLLEGYEVHVTPGVQPPPPQMGEIISCCGGTVLPSMPRSYKPQRVVITCSQDFPRCSIPFRVGLPLLSPEFLLTGVLKQEAKPEAFILSFLEVSST